MPAADSFAKALRGPKRLDLGGANPFGRTAQATSRTAERDRQNGTELGIAIGRNGAKVNE